MKVVTILGARPQFIKAAVCSRAMQRWNESSSEHEKIDEVIVHTGQHYDSNMSQVFFDDLGIPLPKYNLGVGGATHGHATGSMLAKVEDILLTEKPDWVLVYGDTNSTLAGALAAAKLHIKVAHVEAGLRSFNKLMPEEVNRVLTDHISELLLCPTETAVENLKMEGIVNKVYNIGDVMLDASLYYKEKATSDSTILSELGLEPKAFTLATCHRAESTDKKNVLQDIFVGLNEINKEIDVVLPLHPRTKTALEKFNLSHLLSNIRVIEPIPFLDMIQLEINAKFIVTDSGGVQKEAYFYKVPCITMRQETEWTETVEYGWNQLVGTCGKKLIEATKNTRDDLEWPNLYGEGDAGDKIIKLLMNVHK